MSPDELFEWATSGTPNQIGKKGEFLSQIVPDKTRITVGNGKYRVPDRLQDGVITEVKNVATLSNSAQLRDFTKYAGESEKILIVRSTQTHISQSIIDDGWTIKYLFH